MPKILIDGDGCPVIEETIDIACNKGWSVLVLADTSHEFYFGGLEDCVHTILVDKGRDRTDYVLLQNVEKNDIVITQDYGLATLVLSRQAYPLSQNGVLYTDENIGGLLMQRHQGSLMRKHRNYGSNMKKRTKEDDQRFMCALEELLGNLMEE